MVGQEAGDRRAYPRSLEARFVVGPYGVIEEVNAAALALVGYTEEELVGAHGSLLVPREAQPATAVSVDRMRRGEITTRVGQLLRRDGTVLVVDIRSRPLSDGRIVLVVRECRAA